MRILFVTEQYPYPLHDGGNLRTYHILRGLARKHEVWLVSHRAKEDTDAALFKVWDGAGSYVVVPNGVDTDYYSASG